MVKRISITRFSVLLLKKFVFLSNAGVTVEIESLFRETNNSKTFSPESFYYSHKYIYFSYSLKL